MKDQVTLTVPASQVAPPLWNGEQDAQYAVLMDTDGVPTTWVRSADWAIYGRMHGWDRVARIAEGPSLRLPTLLKDGHVVIEGSSYIGIAFDGERVLIGEVGSEALAEFYLVENPTPNDW